MSFLRRIFGLSSKETPLNDVSKIMTSKLPIPDVGGEYYIRFIAKKFGPAWKLDYETNCEFASSGKKKSIDAFIKAKKAHGKGGEKNGCLETVILLLADLENVHLRYSNNPSPIKQDKKTSKYHYVHVLDKMPEEMQNNISCRWTDYQETTKDDSILSPKVDRVAPRRSLPGRRPNSGSGHDHRH